MLGFHLYRELAEALKNGRKGRRAFSWRFKMKVRRVLQFPFVIWRLLKRYESMSDDVKYVLNDLHKIRKEELRYVRETSESSSLKVDVNVHKLRCFDSRITLLERRLVLQIELLESAVTFLEAKDKERDSKLDQWFDRKAFDAEIDNLVDKGCR